MRKRVSKNKRQTSSLKHKIKKRAAETRRKIRKEARKANANKVVQRNELRATKIPNSFPLKKQMIIEADKKQ